MAAAALRAIAAVINVGCAETVLIAVRTIFVCIVFGSRVIAAGAHGAVRTHIALVDIAVGRVIGVPFGADATVIQYGGSAGFAIPVRSTLRAVPVAIQITVGGMSRISARTHTAVIQICITVTVIVAVTGPFGLHAGVPAYTFTAAIQIGCSVTDTVAVDDAVAEYIYSKIHIYRTAHSVIHIHRNHCRSQFHCIKRGCGAIQRYGHNFGIG